MPMAAPARMIPRFEAKKFFTQSSSGLNFIAVYEMIKTLSFRFYVSKASIVETSCFMLAGGPPGRTTGTS
jgi:hypothetical protein